MPKLRTARTSIWWLLAVALPGQVIPVAGGGAALATAVAAAPSGATLIVAAGVYDGFAVGDKDLTIVAPARATITGQLDAVAGTTTRTLTLEALDVVPGPSGSPPGLVQVADNLHMVDCTCRALRVGPVSSAQPANRCWLERCTVTGASVENSVTAHAVIVDCSIQGVPFLSSIYGWRARLGLRMVGSLRAERTVFASSSGATVGSTIAALELWGPGTLANCSLITGAPGQLGLIAWGNVTCWPAPTSAWGLITTRLLATARWNQRNWSTGGTSQVTFHEAPNTAVAMVLSLDLAPWSSPSAAELLWVGSSPNFGIWSLGVSDAQGNHNVTVTIPNVPALQFSEAWLTGLFFDPLPLRTTAPIGGVIR